MAQAPPRAIVVLSLVYPDGVVCSLHLYGADPRPLQHLGSPPGFLHHLRRRWTHPCAPVELRAIVAAGAEAEATRWLSGLLELGWSAPARAER